VRQLLKNVVKEHFDSILLFALGCAMFIAFTAIAVTGKYACEPNRVILGIEIAFTCFVVIYSVVRIYGQEKKHKDSHR
jgi:hypothetical protein